MKRMNKGRTYAAIILLLLFIPSMYGQYKVSLSSRGTAEVLTGNLTFDLAQQSLKETEENLSDTLEVFSSRKYSPLTAGLLSAILPGAGQLYTKNYWQSAAFFGAEVIMWVLYSKYENQGDQRTALFQRYADEHWSVVTYVNWIKSNYINEASKYAMEIPNAQPPPWNQIDWTQLNLCEEEIGRLSQSGFSHKLEVHGEQQYYEMIGKYQQFGGGWDDAATFKPGGFTKQDIINANVSPRFLAYSQMRGDANSSYNIATTVSYVIVANHIFGALEAAWNAARFNHKIHLEGHIQSRTLYNQQVEFVPTFHLQYEL